MRVFLAFGGKRQNKVKNTTSICHLILVASIQLLLETCFRKIHTFLKQNNLNVEKYDSVKL